MKKIFSTLCMALVAVAMMAQDPVITFEKTEHDFGKIHEENGRVSVVFNFKNEGMSPLVLSNVRASCGCTTPTWTKEPVEPGQTGSITVTYNPNGRPGRFQKTVTITSNATEATKRVYIKGEVIPKPAKPVNVYTVAVGELSMKGKTLNLGTIKKGETMNGELEYANLTQAEHSVDLATNSQDAFLISQTTLATVKPNETGKFVFAIDTRNTIKAEIVEDFSQMSVEEKQAAPIIEVAGEIEAGKVAAGKNLKCAFPVKNAGENALEVRRAYSTDKALNVKQPKAIKSGKKGNVAIEINTKDLQPGIYSREVVIISNDYANPVKRVKVNFVIE